MFRRLIKPFKTLQITSDLHLEFVNDVSLSTYLTPSAPALAILGDLGWPTKPNFKQFLKQASHAYEYVFYVAGNHEYYCGLPMHDVNDQINTTVSEFDNVYYLNNDGIIIQNHITLLGTTLWTKIPHMKLNNVSNDFNYIKIKHDTIVPITSHDINLLHNQSIDFIAKHTKNQKTIVLSHHLPSHQLIAPRYKYYKHPYLFASHLDDLIKNHAIQWWCCGHTHATMQVMIGDCHCVTNPYGYRQQQNYNKEFVIKL